ncbi:hypothetical protein LY78DRAFT_683030 [Colletotrichum sublineola]|nr:hypothetical protein LY78DRAFT_683030 [Colletotrichum sublineola]
MEHDFLTDQGAAGAASKTGSLYNAIDTQVVKYGSAYYLNLGSFWEDILPIHWNAAALKVIIISWDGGWPTIYR